MLSIGIVAFGVYSLCRSAVWLSRGEYPAAWCWFTLALLGIPAVLMHPVFKP